MKTKYDWSGVVKEVKWIATDKDRCKSLHIEKPKPKMNSWEDDTHKGYYAIKLPQHNEYKGNWQDSLEERPK